LAAIVESSHDAIIGKTLDGVITSWNAAAERVYGYTAGEIIGRNITALVPSDRAGELTPILARVRLGERVEHYETQRVTKDGSILELSMTISPIRDARGLVMGVSSVTHDMTETKQAGTDQRALQAQLQQAQRLESIGGIAHDFNNLLAGIMNYAGLASSSLQEEMTRCGLDEDVAFATVVEDVDEVTKVAKRAAELTRQLLIFSHRTVAQPEVLDLNAVVGDMEQLLRRTIGENVDHLHTVFARDLPLIKADRGQIEQVVMNLAVNARDAMPDGGELEIETAPFEVDADHARRRAISPGTYARLTVSDTGTGMRDEVAARVFEPFFTTKPTGQGTGLGLATVYGIVTQAGGDITIDSKVDLGTTVRIDLPITGEAEAQPRASRPDMPLSAKGETVLLVEDEEIVRDPVGRMLTRHGYTVLTADGADEAMVIVSEHPGTIDLLLTDVVMPGRSGKELSVAVILLRPAIKVLFMSGYSKDVIGHQGVLEQGVNLIEKPFSAEDLLRKARNVLDDDS
jgi:PAS domain S-box-containing protein